MVTTFTLAVNRHGAPGQKETADFIPVVTWEKIAENCGNSLGKGQRALVEGRIQTRNYEAKDGTKKYVTEIIAQHVEFLDYKKEQINDASHFGNDVPPDDSEIPL